MRYIIIAVLCVLLLPATTMAQGMDIVELDFDSHFLYWLYHYEPKYIMGQIFGAPEFDELGYALGLYWSNQFIKIELPVGIKYNTNVPIGQTHWQTKLNWFAAFPSWENAELEIVAINDFGWGVNGNPNKHFNKWEIIYTPISSGIYLQSFKVGREKFSPFLGITTKIKIGNLVAFQLYQGKKIENSDWMVRLSVFFTYFHN